MSRFLRKVMAMTALVFSLDGLIYAFEFDAQSTDSVKAVAKQLAADLMSMYSGNQPGQTPGLLPQPYYWWEAGALMGALIDYWYYTGDATYNAIIQEGMLHQVGPFDDFMPPNQTLTEGNDDQGFWGMAAMSAAEYNFQDPARNQPQWLALAQAVFNTQAARWDTEYCNGGLRWQIFTWNNGFNYKNSISQACFFNLAARLALYTGNSTYADWAVKTWDWMTRIGFIDKNYRIYDGATVESNCTDITPYEFSYNAGAFLLGAAAMVAYSSNGSGADTDAAITWHERVDGLLDSAELIFFFGNDTNDRVMIEVACEPVNLCDVDQQSFKAYLSRWMAATTKWAPWTFGRIKMLLRNSAEAAVRQCGGGESGRLCGLKWANNSGAWDGTIGVGQQMAVMEVVLANMIHEAKEPVTETTGGTSSGDPNAGGSDEGRVDPVGWHHGPIRAGDRAGAAFVTFFVLVALLAATVFMIADEEDVASREDHGSPSQPAAAAELAWYRFNIGWNKTTTPASSRKQKRRYTASEKGKGIATPESLGMTTEEHPHIRVVDSIGLVTALAPRRTSRQKPLSGLSISLPLPPFPPTNSELSPPQSYNNPSPWPAGHPRQQRADRRLQRQGGLWDLGENYF